MTPPQIKEQIQVEVKPLEWLVPDDGLCRFVADVPWGSYRITYNQTSRLGEWLWDSGLCRGWNPVDSLDAAKAAAQADFNARILSTLALRGLEATANEPELTCDYCMGTGFQADGETRCPCSAHPAPQDGVPAPAVSDGKPPVGPTAKTSLHCKGCPALRTKDWSFQEENDGRDSGTDAECTAMTPAKHISSYWRASTPTPDWCPALTAALEGQS